MSTAPQAGPVETCSLHAEFRHLRSYWVCFLSMGILLVLCGTVAMAFPVLTSFAAVVVLGTCLMIAGLATIITALWAGRWSGLLPQLLIGILYVMVGFLISDRPGVSALMLTSFVAAFFIVAGVFRIAAALALRFTHWGWALLNGAVTLLCGVVIYRHYPESACGSSDCWSAWKCSSTAGVGSCWPWPSAVFRLQPFDKTGKLKMTASISVGRCAAALRSLAAMAWLAGGAGPIAAAEPAAATSPAEAAIRTSAAAFEKAFNARAAADVAALWTLHGTLVDDRGEKYQGREAIQKQYAEFFKDFSQAFPDAKIKVTIKSIEFPAPTMAVEEGLSSIVTSRAAPPVVGAYTATHVLDGGQWLIATVRETAVPPPSNVARLQQELGWLIGRWQAKHDDRSLQTTAAWVGQKSFIRREYSVCQGEKVVSSGVQVIGWGPPGRPPSLLVVRRHGRIWLGPVVGHGGRLGHRERRHASRRHPHVLSRIRDSCARRRSHLRLALGRADGRPEPPARHR